MRVNLEKYVKTFTDNDIDGETVFSESGYSTIFSEMGMESAIDQLRLLARFRLELSGAESAPMMKFLRVEPLLDRIKLDRYSRSFKKRAFDGEMLLFDNIELVQRALTEVGVKSCLDQLRILVYFHKTLSGKSSSYSVDDVFQSIKDDKLGRYCNMIKENEIDGDMLLFESDSLVRAALKELGMEDLEALKLRNKLKNIKGH